MIILTVMLIFSTNVFAADTEEEALQPDEVSYSSCKYGECLQGQTEAEAELRSFAACLDESSVEDCIAIGAKAEALGPAYVLGPDGQSIESIGAESQQLVKSENGDINKSTKLPLCRVTPQHYTNYYIYDPIAQGIPHYIENPPCVTIDRRQGYVHPGDMPIRQQVIQPRIQGIQSGIYSQNPNLNQGYPRAHWQLPRR